LPTIKGICVVSGAAHSVLEPGNLVHHPQRRDWGLGQVQSVVDGKITVNFKHAGKVVILSAHIQLVQAFDEE